ncbi:MAG: hypothetical protein R6V16_09805, partial [Bacteroidales bacterium]
PAGINAAILLDPGSEHALASDLTLPAQRSWFFKAVAKATSLGGPPSGDRPGTRITGSNIILPDASGQPVRRGFSLDGIVFDTGEVQADKNWLLTYLDLVINHTIRRTS